MTIEKTGSGWSKTMRTICVAAFAATATLPTAVFSQQADDMIADAGGSQRVNLSGKLRMLSQRVPAAACYVQLGVDTADTSAMLTAASDEFELITAALEFGNDDLGVFGAEERRKTQVGMGKLNDLWAPIAAMARPIAAGDTSGSNIAAIADQSAPLLDMAKIMVTEIVGQYSRNATMVQADAMLIDIAGRQRMLAQRMSKNVCLIASGINTDQAIAELQATSEIFDTSLMALRAGMVSAGINPPPTEEVAEGLDTVIATWGTVQPIVDVALSGEAPDAAQLSLMFQNANALTGQMNAVVGLYTEASAPDS